MKIVARVTFRHGGSEYLKGGIYTVAQEDALYFLEAGWAVDASGRIKAKPLVTDREVAVQPNKGVIKGHTIFKHINEKLGIESD